MHPRPLALLITLAALLALSATVQACWPPGTRICDGNTTQVCRNDTYVNDTECEYGCLNGECRLPPAPPKACPQWADEFVERVANITQKENGSARNCTVTMYARYCINAARKVNTSWVDRRNESECKPWVALFAPCDYRLNSSDKTVEKASGQCRQCEKSAYVWYCPWNRSYDAGRRNETRSCTPWMACDRLAAANTPAGNASKPAIPNYAPSSPDGAARSDYVTQFIKDNATAVAVVVVGLVILAVVIVILTGNKLE